MQTKATKNLPDHYRLISRLDIREGKPLLVMNLVGLALMVAAWFGFGALANQIHPGSVRSPFATTIVSGDNFLEPILSFFILIAAIVATLLVHEAIHGFCFWLFTGTRPKLAFKGFYAYAAAPDWYLPRGQYAVTGLAPLVVIDAVCIALMPQLQPGWMLPLMWVLVFNTSGAAGDLWMMAKLLCAPHGVLANDKGDVLELYALVESRD